MSTEQYDVIVVGAGNAAMCAAMSAQENGAKVIILERAPEDEAGGNSRYTAGALRFAYNGLRGHHDARRADRRGNGEQRLRHLHDRPVLRRHVPRDPVPHRPGTVRDPGDQELRDHPVDAQQGRPIHADLRPPGVQGRRQVQVLGRPRAGILGRRSWHLGNGIEERQGPGHSDPVRAPRRIAALRRGEGLRREGQAQEQGVGNPRQVRDPRLRRLRVQLRMAHALPRTGLGPGEGARHALQHRRRHQDGARHRRHALRQLVGLPRGRLGPQRAGIRRPRGRRQLPEAQLSVRHHGQRRRASASSTKVPTSATTPTPSTARSS